MSAHDDSAAEPSRAGRQRPLALADRDRVAGVVVERRRRGEPARRAAAAMPDAGPRDEHDGEAGAADPQRPVDVLDVGEQPSRRAAPPPRSPRARRPSRPPSRGRRPAARRRPPRRDGRSPSGGRCSRAAGGNSAPAYWTRAAVEVEHLAGEHARVEAAPPPRGRAPRRAPARRPRRCSRAAPSRLRARVRAGSPRCCRPRSRDWRRSRSARPPDDRGRTASGVPSSEPLSTQIVSMPRRDSRQASVSSRPFHERTTATSPAVTSGGQTAGPQLVRRLRRRSPRPARRRASRRARPCRPRTPTAGS